MALDVATLRRRNHPVSNPVSHSMEYERHPEAVFDHRCHFGVAEQVDGD
jgi:hypothetical protein